jgi:hypothetical protein
MGIGAADRMSCRCLVWQECQLSQEVALVLLADGCARYDGEPSH